MSMIGTGRALLGPWAGYLEKARGVEPSSLVGLWLQNEQSGAISYDLSGQGNSGAYTGVTLGQAGVPGMGMTSPFFDGTNDYNNVYSAGLAADFSGVTGTMLTWHKVNAPAVWSDGTARYLFQLLADGSNYVLIYKSNVSDYITYHYAAGGVLESALKNTTETGWMCLAMTWNAAGDMIAYYNGEDTGSPAIAGTWAGAIASNKALIGAGTITPANPAHGRSGPSLLYIKDLTAAQIAYLSKV